MSRAGAGARRPGWARLVLPFAAAYFLSYLYRTVNAVVGPVIVGELSLSGGAIGLLTAAYFLSFAAAQLPLGVLLDRFGARRVEAALLSVAALGALAFALGRGLLGLAAGRALVGLGVSACLMAAFKSFSQWFAADRQASLTGWIMTSGGLGSLAASAPLEAVLRVAGWREVFVGLAAATLAAAAFVFLAVPDGPRERPVGAGPGGEGWAGAAAVFRSPAFFRVAPMGLAFVGGFMAVQGLWSTSWLMEVSGRSRAVAADHLAAMAAAMLGTYLLVGLWATPLSRRGIETRHLLGGGVAAALLALLGIVLEVSPRTGVLWVAYGAFSSFGTLSYPEAARSFPVSLSGRVNTALNVVVFVGAFAIQWGMGLSIDALRAAGLGAADAHRVTFAALLLLQALSYGWFLAAPRPLPRPAVAAGEGAGD